MYNKNDKEKYEQLINESPIFTLDKETEKIAFIKERTRMIEHLYNYLLSISKKYEPYGYEITEVAIRCIESFDNMKGEFLHYFNFAWKRKYSDIQLEKYMNNKYGSLHISENDVRNVRKYIKFVEKLGKDYELEELYLKLSEVMQLPVNKIRELAQLSNLHVVGDSDANEEDEGKGQNFIPDNVDIEKMIIEREEQKEFLDKIERVFNSLQNRQKPIISDIMTIKLWPYLEEIEKKYSFISKDAIEEWKESGVLPTQREIAKKNNREETSVSRTVREFLEKVRKEI